MNLEDLKGVGDKTAEKMREAGYNTVLSVARTSSDSLASRTDIGQGRAEKIVNSARDHVEGNIGGFKTGKEVKKEQDELRQITTSSEALDNVLCGGVPTTYMTEAYGKNSRGKTQLGLQLTANVQLPEDEGGLDKKALFIDTENTFDADRFIEIAEAAGLDADEALDNVIIADVNDSGEQMQMTKDAFELCAEKDIGLVVVDSLMTKFRAEYSGREKLGERQALVGEHINDLKELARQFQLAVYVTNQVHSDPGQRFGDPTKAIGGNVVSHNADFILYLKGQTRFLAELEDSPSLPEAECEFNIDEDGIGDV